MGKRMTMDELREAKPHLFVKNKTKPPRKAPTPLPQVMADRGMLPPAADVPAEAPKRRGRPPKKRKDDEQE